MTVHIKCAIMSQSLLDPSGSDKPAPLAGCQLILNSKSRLGAETDEFAV
jgi:hypothetical protein